MHKNATKCNKTLSKWCKNKHGASKIIDTFETYQASIKIFKNISIFFLIIIKAKFKYIINLIFIRCIISIFKQISKFECTLPSNKFFNLLHIIKVIICLNIRRYGNIIIILTLKREVFVPPTVTRFIKAISNIISRAHISSNNIQFIN
jgi:hypothetical protein